jgi:hypothetical protein
MHNKYIHLFETSKLFVVHVSSIFLLLYHRSGRIQGRILFRGEERNTKKERLIKLDLSLIRKGL